MSTEVIQNFSQDAKMFRKYNVLNMRLVNLKNLPNNNLRNKSSFIRAKYGTVENAAQSLDLLRQVLQASINEEINKIIKHHVEIYFEPAKQNIKVNCGISDDTAHEFVNDVCCQILEEAKKMYSTPSSMSSHNTRQQNVNNKPLNKNLLKVINNTTEYNNLSPKRKRTHSSGSESNLPFFNKRKTLPYHFKPSSGRSTPNKKSVVKAPVKKEGPKWDSSRLTTATQFIMGSKANKALGLGATRGRLYIKHPELFKYGGDQDDKQWLHENALMPATGGRTYLLILEDILQLTKLDDYRDSPGLEMKDMVGFHVPSWMVEKMKALMDSQHTNKPSKHNQSTDDRNESHNDETSKNKDDKNEDDDFSFKESDLYGKLMSCDFDNWNEKVSNRDISKSNLTNKDSKAADDGEDD